MYLVHCISAVVSGPIFLAGGNADWGFPACPAVGLPSLESSSCPALTQRVVNPLLSDFLGPEKKRAPSERYEGRSRWP